jgi:ADP-ribosyl-[dinitrogen reductase] hydrolase
MDNATQQRAIGALIGSAVGDALGAPFEFGRAGAYRKRFPEPVIGGIGEMVGGGSFGWEPAEFTDDTQMAVALAESLLASGGLDPEDLWTRFRTWAATAKDVGNTTRLALRHTKSSGAAEVAHRELGKSAGNGALMRATPLALFTLGDDRDRTVRLAVSQAALTHADPAAGWGAAIGAELVRISIGGHDPFIAVPDVLSVVPVEHRDRYELMLAPSWSPGADALSNGSVWGCLAEAVWAVRTTDSFEDAVVAAIELGGDTDTVACVTGALAGALYGIQSIPSRWTTYLHGSVATPSGVETYDNARLQALARRLIGLRSASETAADEPAGPTEVAPGLFAADLGNAAGVPADWAVVSMCRTGGRFAGHPYRREVFLIDKEGDANLDAYAAVADAVRSIDAFLAEGRNVVVHCHGGRSRTGLVLKAWAMRRFGLDERGAHAWLEQRWSRYEDYNRSFVRLLDEHTGRW